MALAAVLPAPLPEVLPGAALGASFAFGELAQVTRACIHGVEAERRRPTDDEVELDVSTQIGHFSTATYARSVFVGTAETVLSCRELR